MWFALNCLARAEPSRVSGTAATQEGGAGASSHQPTPGKGSRVTIKRGSRIHRLLSVLCFERGVAETVGRGAATGTSLRTSRCALFSRWVCDPDLPFCVSNSRAVSCSLWTGQPRLRALAAPVPRTRRGKTNQLPVHAQKPNSPPFVPGRQVGRSASRRRARSNGGWRRRRTARPPSRSRAPPPRRG